MMDQTVQEIRSEIEESKRKISQTAHKVEERFEEISDWRALVDRYPLASFAVSVGVGFVLAGNAKPMVNELAGRTGDMLKASLMGMLLPRIFPPTGHLFSSHDSSYPANV